MVIFSVLMVIGYVFARKGLDDRSFGRSASMLALNVFLPATILNSVNAKVRTLSSRDIGGGQAITIVTLEVKNASELHYIMGRLSGVAGVSAVQRNGD